MLWSEPFSPLLTQFGPSAAFIPAADLTVGERDLVLILDLPGLTSEDISIDDHDRIAEHRASARARDGLAVLGVLARLRQPQHMGPRIGNRPADPRLSRERRNRVAGAADALPIPATTAQ